MEVLSALGGIILVDLLLSGDNALVIGTAASVLPRRQRWMAIVLGGVGAVILRIAFAFIATLLLQLPLLQAIGGCVLLIIAVRLLADRKHKVAEQGEGKAAGELSGPGKAARSGLMGVILTVLVADVTMSLDNVLAVGALADGNLPLLAAGILLSIIVLLFGSVIVSELVRRVSILLDIAALVLAWTGANMILSDIRLGPVLDDYAWTTPAIIALAFTIVLAADIWLRLRDKRV